MRSDSVGLDARPFGQAAIEASVPIVRGCFALLLLALLAGCAEPRLDASSQERVLASTATLRSGLVGEDLTEFDALMSEAIDSSRRPGMETSLADTLVIYNGMTAREVVEKHRKLREAQIASEADRNKALYARIRDVKAQQAELKKVQISEAAIKESSDGRVFIHAFINNGLPYTITSIKVRVELRTQGRELPWASGQTTFGVSGGIESGERVQAVDWIHFLGQSEQAQHPEAELNFVVEKVVRADGTPVPNLDGISDDDWRRFAEIESEAGAAQTDSVPPS